MPVKLTAPDPASLLPVAGVRLGIASAGIKKPGRRDITLIELAPDSRVAGVFTQNRFCAAPVTLCKPCARQINRRKYNGLDFLPQLPGAPNVN